MRTLLCIALALPIVLSACDSRTVTRSDPTPGDASGSFDPDAKTFVLQRVVTTDLEPTVVELIGSNVVVDPDSGTVSVEVAIRNAGDRELYEPATVWLRDFRPRDVRPINADVLLPSEEVLGDTWGYRYDGTFGDDGRLSPGEVSGRRLWRFEDPGAAPFSFSVRAEFTPEPGASISGVVFVDMNQNGIREPDEGLLETGWLARLTTPDGAVRETEPRGDGRYVFPISEPGLHRVELIVLIEPVWCVTTPNPLEVLITPDPDGGPRSYDDADFGFAFGPCHEPLSPVILSDLEPSDIEPQDPYALMELTVEGDVLILTVGFSGCSPEHPFALYAADEVLFPVPGDIFIEPLLPWMILSHDDLDEPCDAYFTRRLVFDLSPFRELHAELFRVDFYDQTGDVHPFIYER